MYIRSVCDKFKCVRDSIELTMELADAPPKNYSQLAASYLLRRQIELIKKPFKARDWVGESWVGARVRDAET